MSIKLQPMIIFGDVHRPYHDKRAWALFLKVAKAFKPHHLVCMGDFADFYAVSSHSKDPKRSRLLADELEDVKVGFDELDALKATNKVFIGGNHCLTPDHRVLTQTGWKFYTQLSTGERVAGRLPDGTLTWQPIQQIHERMTEQGEEIYHHRRQNISTSVTANHKICGKSTNGSEWTRAAKDCPVSFNMFMAVNSALPEYPLTDDQIQLAAWASTDVYYEKRYDGVSFYQSEGKQHLIQNILNQVGITYKLRSRDRAPHSICGKILKSHKVSYEFALGVESGRKIRELTGLTSKSRLPKWAHHLSDRQWDVFQHTLILADGTYPRKGSTSCTFNGKKEICEDVQAAAITHGWRASISEYRPGSFRVNLTKHNLLRIDKWQDSSKTTDPTLVFCLTVPSGNFIVERHGRAYVTGNCDRLTRYLQDKAPELFGVTSIPKVFDLDHRGWSYVPYKSHTKIGKLFLSHDCGSAGRTSTFKALDTYQHSIITGHAHRLQYIVEGNAVGEFKLSAQFGWLGDIHKIDYMNRAVATKNWALGFGVGYLNPSTGYVYLTPVPIVNYTCVVNGVLYQG